MSDGAVVEEAAVTPLAGLRRAAARHMVRAWEAPSFSLSVSVEMTSLLARKSSDVTVTDLFVHAVAGLLVSMPDVNAHFVDAGVARFAHANVGVAVATDRGLVVPVITRADTLDLESIATERRRLVQAARNGGLSRDDIGGGTFTISNLGMQGIDRFTAIVNAPEVAILAVGATTDRFVRRDGVGVWVPKADLTLSCDHRVLDGAAAAGFLAALRDVLEADG